MPPRIHIIGRKNSGKTTLITELIEHLNQLGYSVGTIKHTHHHHELDTPNKDSYRHRAAGAQVVGILAREMNAVFWPAQPSDEKGARYRQMLNMYAACDFVLVEGDSQAEAFKIEVWRAGEGEAPLAMADTTIRALVTDDPVSMTVPVLARRDVPALAKWLLDAAAESRS